jgi:hypothetical protein
MLRKILAVLPIFLVFSLVMYPSPASAVGIGVSPGKVEYRVLPGGTAVQTLYVINQSDCETELLVHIEGGNEDWFEITPREFTLNVQETEGVEIRVSPPLMTPPQEQDVSICIVALPSDSDLRVGAGIKVTAHVQLLEFPLTAIQWWLVTAILTVFAVAGILVWWRRKARHA